MANSAFMVLTMANTNEKINVRAGLISCIKPNVVNSTYVRVGEEVLFVTETPEQIMNAANAILIANGGVWL